METQRVEPQTVVSAHVSWYSLFIVDMWCFMITATWKWDASFVATAYGVRMPWSYSVHNPHLTTAALVL